jgi:hypothetical protein
MRPVLQNRRWGLLDSDLEIQYFTQRLVSYRQCERITAAHLNSYFLNPMLDASCSNLWLNASYCVQPVSDIKTYPGYGGATTATLPEFTAGPKTSLTPNEDPVAAPDQIIVPMANDTRVDCWRYVE